MRHTSDGQLIVTTFFFSPFRYLPFLLSFPTRRSSDLLPNDEWNRRSRFTLKLTGLPSGTTIVDLLDVFDATKAKTIVIPKGIRARSEEHTSELQSRFDLVCRLLLEKKQKIADDPQCATLAMDNS